MEHLQTSPTLKPGETFEQQKKKFDRWWFLVFGVILLIIILVFLEPDPYQRIVLFVSDGIGVTVYTTLVSFVLVLIFDLIGGLGRLSKNRIINGLATVYVEVVRGQVSKVFPVDKWKPLAVWV